MSLAVFRKIKQIINDHKAMNVIRDGNGDAKLEVFIGVNGRGWDCWLFQREGYTSASDPADAILNANKARSMEDET